MNHDDSILVRKVRGGDHYAFKQIFHLYSSRLCRLVYSIVKNKEVAEDVVQDFFVTYWLKRETLEFNPSFLSYAYKSVYNASLNYLRDTKQRMYTLPDDIYDVLYEDEALHLEQEKLEKKLYYAIEQLPPRCKEVFLKAKVDKKSYAEIAAELGISENTVKAQVSKAYRMIKDYMAVFLCIFLN